MKFSDEVFYSRESFVMFNIAQHTRSRRQEDALFKPHPHSSATHTHPHTRTHAQERTFKILKKLNELR